MDIMSPYKLACTLTGHDSDVRSISCIGDAIVSGSRDKTCKVWKPVVSDQASYEYRNIKTFVGHNKFITCTCIISTGEDFLIATGSNDHTINVYGLASDRPIYSLIGHKDTVCCIVAGENGGLISGSWDKTVKVWLSKQCQVTIKGHAATVWAVAALKLPGFILTASADKSIKLWDCNSSKDVLQNPVTSYIGHEDCVRSLAVVSSQQFISCSNDSTIRRWMIESGECVFIYSEHKAYIYSLSLYPDQPDRFVSCGEDRTVRVWNTAGIEETFTLPVTSIWSVAVLNNGDIATGSSDGTVRVFSQNAGRQLSADCQAVYEAEVAQHAIAAESLVGGKINLNDLPDEMALGRDGTKDGQTLIVRADSKAIVYNWSSHDKRWVQIGEVVNQSGSGPSEKVWYCGKEYDFVFDVDIQEGQPTLKLPYNKTDDPWSVAHQFLLDNDLSPLFLDQIANFVVDNSGGQINPSANLANNPGDPLTGGNRYVPGATVSTGPGGSDPFTGDNRYVPGGGSSVKTTPGMSFLASSYIAFTSAKVPSIIAKLKEFNAQVDNGVSDPELLMVEQLAEMDHDSGRLPADRCLEALDKVLKFPLDKMFPCLDVLRLCILNTVACDGIVTKDDDLLQLLTRAAHSYSVPNHMLACRVLANLFATHPGMTMVGRHADKILPIALAKEREHAAAGFQRGQSAVLHNLALLVNRGSLGDVELVTQLLLGLIELLNIHEDSESIRQLLVALGTLAASGDINRTLVASSVEVRETLEAFKKDVPFVAALAYEVSNYLRY